MTTRRLIGAILTALILALGLLAPASPAQAATGAPSVTATETACGVDLLFNNPTKWTFSFDYRVDGQAESAPVEPALADLTIKEGPLKGEPFGPRYQVVTLPSGDSATAEIRFDTAGPHTVAYQLRRGAEQHLFLPWVTVELDVPKSCVPTPEPTTEPTAEPTVGPTTDPTAGPGVEPTTGPGAPGGGGGDELPVTGAAGGLAVGAVLLLAAGVVLVRMARRRRVTFTA